MKIQEFIKQEYGIADDIANRVKDCSSVFKDEHGYIYSYGYHYPLAFKVNGLNFINTSGYSISTAKHISWAKQSIRDYIEIKLPSNISPRNYITTDQKALLLGKLQDCLANEAADLLFKMTQKRRKDTKTYQNLYLDYKRARNDLEKVREALNEIDTPIRINQ